MGKKAYLRVISILKVIIDTAEKFRAEEEKNPMILIRLFSAEDIKKLREAIEVLEKPFKYTEGDLPQEYKTELLNRALKTGLLKMRVRVDGREMGVLAFDDDNRVMTTEDDDGNRYKIRDPKEGEIIALDSDDEDGKAAIIEMFKATTSGEA
jgi:hypothetical protein